VSTPPASRPSFPKELDGAAKRRRNAPPAREPALPGRPPPPPVLLQPEELVYGNDGNLPLARDPKLAWALAHPDRFPVEASTADRETLLRVPGLGPKTVDRLLATRRGVANLDRKGLRRLGIVASRAAGFLAWHGRKVGTRAIQDTLFPPEEFPAPSRVYSFSPGTFR